MDALRWQSAYPGVSSETSMTFDQRIQAANATLSPQAVRHEGVLGRRNEEPEDATRFPFQRDRDRIIHTTSFRRLQGKTQVFVAGEGDHFRTRLTHTMEVAQIARDLARALCLNEDLAECIALAHDLGHPPFGHSGEAALNAWMQEQGSHFEHNEQSHRIVTVLERHSSRHQGLNLNQEVEQGLLKHTTAHPTLEAQVVNLADEIAYTSHDCDDGILAKLFSINHITEIPLARDAWERARGRGTMLRGSLVHLLVSDLLSVVTPQIQSNNPEVTVALSPSMRLALDELKAFLWEHMYPHPRIRIKAEEGMRIVDLLCRHFAVHPSEKIRTIAQRTGATLPEAIKDYVAGMTDAFAWLHAGEYGLLPLASSEEQ